MLCFPPTWQIVHQSGVITFDPSCAFGRNSVGPLVTKRFTATGQWSLPCLWALHLIDQTSSQTSGAWSYFNFCISKHKFWTCAWICYTSNPRSCTGVLCSCIVASNASAWVEIFCCDKADFIYGISDVMNQAQCCASVRVMLALRIVLFNL